VNNTRETEWIHSIVIGKLQKGLKALDEKLLVEDRKKLPYTCEILFYNGDTARRYNANVYETDVLIYEKLPDRKWKPRIIIEAKIKDVTTHDAITYSQKASTHKNVHPYLRYGILLGNRKHYPLPRRLIRHGAHFDFMLSWRGYEPTDGEWQKFISIIDKEIAASRKLEEILYNSGSPNKERYCCLHRPLILE